MSGKCNIVATLTVKMDPFVIERLVYEGSDPSDTWIVVGLGHSKMNMQNVHKAIVNNISEYESGCQIHPDQRCAGHLCETPEGRILPMQSLAINTGTMTNDVALAAKVALEGDSAYHEEKYKKILADSMKTKTGRMRKGILNCHIDGSLRMVITPHDTMDFCWVYIPNYIQDKWTVPYLDEKTRKHSIRKVQHGDYAIVLRPPTLYIKSLQCMRIAFWNKTCMGISPYILEGFSGDYDGDEMHVYPVYSSAAVQECSDWVCEKNAMFEKAFEEFEKLNPKSRESSVFDYMEYTTLSFDEISKGAEQPRMAEYARTSKDHLKSFKERYKVEEVTDRFVSESIRGMADTNAQQISQPIVGDMSRLSKLASGCILQREDGTIEVATRTSSIPVSKAPVCEQAGNTAMRCISYIARKIQQSLLQSHHAKKSMMPGHDIISDMLSGSDNTMILLDGCLSNTMIRSSLRPKLLHRFPNETCVICKPERVSVLPKNYILGSYNPKVLSMLDEKSRLGACRSIITSVVRYYEVPVTFTEIECLSVLFSYETDKSEYPITSRKAMGRRNLRWTEVMMATHYSKLIEMVEEGEIGKTPIDTISAKLMAGNMFG